MNFLGKVYDVFNTISITAWIVVIYLVKEKWTFDARVHHLLVALGLILLTIVLGALSLFLTRYLGKDNIDKCIEVELADASSLPSYLGYFLIAFSVSNIYHLIVATVFISIFLFFMRRQYFNMTYLFFGYHCYHVTTDMYTKIFVICKKEIRTPKNIQFEKLRRINNTTYIDEEV